MGVDEQENLDIGASFCKMSNKTSAREKGITMYGK